MTLHAGVRDLADQLAKELNLRHERLLDLVGQAAREMRRIEATLAKRGPESVETLVLSHRVRDLADAQADLREKRRELDRVLAVLEAHA